ncbi:hypothetical protein FKP32DRAFT_1608332 [Trametes sanguinea]|nr:hypothetical protein FKP32DRAFT_1671563 [Trametes sanguinea]KAI9069527.1 hypothetical protein FKP32DRAFT_1608332 [Trametes sanguinea]
MEPMASFDTIFLPARANEARIPTLVPLFAPKHVFPSKCMEAPYMCGRMPHPEQYMDYVANTPGKQVWGFHCIEALEGMVIEKYKFSRPYVLFYPLLSRDGMPFPVNGCIQAMQGEWFDKRKAWEGDIIIAKYSDPEYSEMIDVSMADFPIIKNYLSTHRPPWHIRNDVVHRTSGRTTLYNSAAEGSIRRN